MSYSMQNMSFWRR